MVLQGDDFIWHLLFGLDMLDQDVVQHIRGLLALGPTEQVVCMKVEPALLTGQVNA